MDEEKTAGVRNGHRATIRDIAEVAGVSPSTVSRVLSKGASRQLISEETRLRVQAVADQMNYRPNPMAKALRSGQSHLIGLIVCAIADPFFAQLIQSLSNIAHEQGYEIVLGYAHEDAAGVAQMANVLDLRHVDGVIVIGNLETDDEAVRVLQEEHPAVVALCRGSASARIASVNVDNAAGIKAVMDHLESLQHRQIGFIGGGSVADIQERQAAFVKEMRERSLPLVADFTQEVDFGIAGGYQGMRRILTLPEYPTAVMAADDMMAIGALKAILDAGLTVPGDISITGFDDIEIASYTAPTLTTVRQPIQAMADAAIQQVVGLIQHASSDFSIEPIRIVPEIVIHGSTGIAPRR